MRSEMRRALPRLLPANTSPATLCPVSAPLPDLIEVAPVSVDRIIGFFV